MNDKEKAMIEQSRADLAENLSLQALKIRELLQANEALGAEACELRNRAGSLEHQLERAQTHIEELAKWRDLCQARLGRDVASASHQLDVWWSHVLAMQSPGHRLVSVMGRALGNGRAALFLRKLMNFVLALKKA